MVGTVRHDAPSDLLREESPPGLYHSPCVTQRTVQGKRNREFTWLWSHTVPVPSLAVRLGVRTPKPVTVVGGLGPVERNGETGSQRRRRLIGCR